MNKNPRYCKKSLLLNFGDGYYMMWCPRLTQAIFMTKDDLQTFCKWCGFYEEVRP